MGESARSRITSKAISEMQAFNPDKDEATSIAW